VAVESRARAQPAKRAVLVLEARESARSEFDHDYEHRCAEHEHDKSGAYEEVST
jgi:hypothetical protein